MEPIVQSNRAWEAARQTPLRSAAQQWQQTKSGGLLYRDKALKDALAWTKDNPAEVEPYEQTFLEASQQAQQTRARRRRLMIGGTAVGILILLALSGLTVWAVHEQNVAHAAQRDAVAQKDRADKSAADAQHQAQIAENETQIAQKQSQISFYRQLAAETTARLSDHFDLALLLSIETARLGDKLRSSGTLTDTHESRGNLLKTVVANPQVAGFLNGHFSWVNSVAFSNDGKIMASASTDHSIILWDVAARQPLGTPLTGHSDEVFISVAFSPVSQTLAAGSCGKSVNGKCAEGEIILWDVTNPLSPTQLGSPLSGHKDWVNSVAFSKDGKTLASGSDDQSIILWDMTNPSAPTQLGTLMGHQGAVNSVAFSPVSQTLVSGSTDGTTILWDVTNPRAPTQLGDPLFGHTNSVKSVTFSEDGKILASGSADKSIILWDVTNPISPTQLGGPLTGHPSSVDSVAFSPDGQTLASGSADKSIILWDVATRQRLGALTGHADTVNSVAFSPDGKTLASGSDDKSVMLWDVDSESWKTRICQLVGRNLTQGSGRSILGSRESHIMQRVRSGRTGSSELVLL